LFIQKSLDLCVQFKSNSTLKLFFRLKEIKGYAMTNKARCNFYEKILFFIGEICKFIKMRRLIMPQGPFTKNDRTKFRKIDSYCTLSKNVRTASIPFQGRIKI